MDQTIAHEAKSAGKVLAEDSYPHRLGPFVVAARIEESGVGKAYLAVPDEHGQKACRLRHLRLSGRQAPDLVAIFRRAGEVARRLSHPGVEETLAVGQLDDDLFVAQSFRPGTLLSRLPARLLPVPAAVYVARQVALALAYLHGFRGHGMVHHRVGPSNIYIGCRGEVKLLDCSLACELDGSEALPRALRLAGRYVAPEVHAGERGDGRSDIYALGVVLWELLTGRTFGRPEGSRHVPLPSRYGRDVPAGLDVCIARAIDPDPRQRFAKMSQMASALRKFSDGRWAGPRALRQALATVPELVADRRQLRDRLAAARRLAAGAKREPLRRLGWNWRLGVGWASPVALIVGAAAFAAWSNTHPAPPLAASSGLGGERSYLGSGAPVPLPAAAPPSTSAPPLGIDPAAGATGTELAMPESPPLDRGRAPRRLVAGRRLAARPSTAEAHARALGLLQAAQSRFHWGDLEGAERLAREAVPALGKEPRAHYFLGLVLMARGQPEAAAAAFAETLALDPHHADAASKLRLAEEHASIRNKVDYDTVAP